MRNSLAASLACFAMIIATGPAGAAGDNNSGSSQTTQQCRDGKVWDKQKKECVDPKKGEIDDDSIYEAGRDLAYAYRYDEAIEVLHLAANPNDKRILNFLGYSNRKVGRLEVGLGYYREALAIDPTYTLAREYYGEALLTKGDVEGAREQLAVIEKLCGGQTCAEYTDLAWEIKAYAYMHGG